MCQPIGAKKKKKEAAAAPATKPGVEHHILDLALPLDWAKLMGLVQTARSGAMAWKNLVVAGKKRTGPLPPDTWPAEMPMSGKVEFDVKPAASKPGVVCHIAPLDWWHTKNQLSHCTVHKQSGIYLPQFHNRQPCASTNWHLSVLQWGRCSDQTTHKHA